MTFNEYQEKAFKTALDLLDAIKTLHATANYVIGVNKSIIEKNRPVSAYLSELNDDINRLITKLERTRDGELVLEEWFRKCISLSSAVYQYVGFIDGFLVDKGENKK